MYILTPENKSFDTTRIPASNTELYYSVLDYSDKEDIDYKFMPIVFVEDFAKASAVLRIGQFMVEVPLHWSVLIGDKEFGDLELMPLIEVNGRDFSVFAFNPCQGFMPKFIPFEIVNIYQEVRWCVPSVMAEHLLSVPLCKGENPLCAFFAEAKNKWPDNIDIKDLI